MKIKLPYINTNLILLSIGIILLFDACNIYKNVPENKYLLENNKVFIDTKEIKIKDIEPIIKPTPNKRILGLRFHLAMYNLAKPESNKWLSRTFRNLGEEPVLYDDFLMNKSKIQMELYIKNKGYLNSTIADTVILKNKKAIVKFFIKAGIPYKIQQINYNIEDSVLQKLIFKDTINSYVKQGNIFNINLLQDERTRIEHYLKNIGYFGFSREYVYYEADSNLNNNHVMLKIGIKNISQNIDNKIINNLPHQTYTINKITVFPDYDVSVKKDSLSSNNDSVTFNDIKFIYRNNEYIRPSILAHNIYIQKGNLYSQNDIDLTYKNLSYLRLFKYVNIQFVETGQLDSLKHPTVDCIIQLSSQNFQSFQIEPELTSSLGIGVANSFIYQHKNLFRGAETFDIQLKGSTEFIRNNLQSKFGISNTLELGVESKLIVNRFLVPFNSQKFIKKYNPQTQISGSYNYRRRPEYSHLSSLATFGYAWKGNEYLTHIFNPFEINYVNLLDSSSVYFAQISPYLISSYLDHLLSVTSYSLIFNNHRSKQNTAFSYLRFSAESAGNMIHLSNKLFNRKKTNDNSYEIFNIRYAQYLKSNIEISQYLPINETDKIVFHIFTGFAFPYGNSVSIPFEKQYFGGGANSMRAWQMRSLGPGSFHDTASNITLPNKSADIKLEGNVEYRFKLFWKIEGALFTDVGNIWSINNYDERENAQFKLNTFYKEIAIGSGIGIRFDFSFFVLRTDLGIKIFNPTNIVNEKWLLSKQVIWKNDVNLSIGIGYPF